MAFLDATHVPADGQNDSEHLPFVQRRVWHNSVAQHEAMGPQPNAAAFSCTHLSNPVAGRPSNCWMSLVTSVARPSRTERQSATRASA